jgi:hypothetical protein
MICPAGHPFDVRGAGGARDAGSRREGHNGGVAEGIGWLVAFFRRAQERTPGPSGWALAFDAVIAVGAAAGAVFEMAQRSFATVVVTPVSIKPAGTKVFGPFPVKGGVVPVFFDGVPAHASGLMLIAAAMTALPLAARRIYPISVWIAIALAIVAVHGTYVPPVALGTAVFAAYSAITHSRYRNLAIAVVAAVTLVVAGILGPGLPRFPGGSPRSSRSCPPPWRAWVSVSCAAGWPTPTPG